MVVELPTFAENNNNKENLIKELLQENGVVNAQEGINPGIAQPQTNTINIGGAEKPVEKSNKKKGCHC